MSLGFSYLRSCHLQTAIKILSDLGDIYFSWYIALARISSEVLNKIVKVSIVVLFPILEEMLWAFYHWVWCKLWACPIWALLHNVHFFYNLICSEFLLWKVVDFVKCFFSICWFLFFILLTRCIRLIDLQILNYPWKPEIILNWSWCIIHSNVLLNLVY